MVEGRHEVVGVFGGDGLMSERFWFRVDVGGACSDENK